MRVGLIVPRHKRSAVDRNRLKRRLRELSRTRLLPALAPLGGGGGGGGDLVIRARPEAYGASFEALARQVERVGRDAGRILSKASPPTP